MAHLLMSGEQKEYHQFYTPPPVRSEAIKNGAIARKTSSTTAERKISMVLLNSRKLTVARLMTFSRLQQSKLKTRLKILKFRQQLSERGNMAVSQTMDSGIADVVTASGLENPDHMGWLVDQSCCERRWCVVADMLFCVFENDFCESPVQVFVLPGYEVKNLVYNSAKRSVLSEVDKATARHTLDTVTVSGMLRYQFVLKDKVTAKTHVFGMNNKTELEIWMSVLRNAVHLDISLFEDSDSDCEEQDSSYKSKSSQNSTSQVRRSSSTVGSSQSEVSSKAESLDYSHPDKKDASDTSSDSSKKAVQGNTQKCSGENIRNHVKNNIDKATLLSDSCVSFDTMNYVPSHRSSERRKVSNLSKISSGSNQSASTVHAFSKVIRSNSCKDVLYSYNRENSSGSDNLHEGESEAQSIRKFSSIDDFRKKLRKQSKSGHDKLKKFKKMHSSNNLEVSTDIDLPDEHSNLRTWSGPQEGVSLTYKHELVKTTDEASSSVELRKPARVKKSNSLKEFLFGGKYLPNSDETGCEQTTCSSGNTDFEAYIHHKQFLKWVRLWCKVCDKHLYGFKSQEAVSSTPELSLYLPDCSLALVNSDKGRRIYTFKICQPNVRSLYFSADKLDDYCQWLDVLKKETNTMDLFRRRSSLDVSEMHKSEDKSTATMGFQNELRRQISETSTISSDSLTSNVSVKSSSSLGSYLKNQMKSLKSSKSAKASLCNGQVSLTNLSSVNLQPMSSTQGNPSTEKVKQRLRDHRKYSMPNLTYTAIMEQAKSASFQTKTGVSQRLMLTSASSGNLHSHFSTKTTRLSPQESLEDADEVSTSKTLIVKKDVALSRSSRQVVTQTDEVAVNEEVQTQTKYVNGSLLNRTDIAVKNGENMESYKRNNEIFTNQDNMSKDSTPVKADGPSIFNTHLPGPNNEGLLLVRDDITDHHREKKPILSHQRVNSDGNIFQSAPQTDNSTDKKSTNQVYRDPVRLGVAARELDSPCIQGYLDRLMDHQDDWVNIWGVLKEDKLFVYSSPIDEQSMDMLDVKEWEVSTAEKMASREQVLTFRHPKFEPQYFSSDSPSDIEEWKNQLQKMSRKDLMYEKDADRSTVEEAEENQRMEPESVDTQKSELLKYLFSQKKQAIKSIQGRRSLSQDSSSQDTDLSSEVTDKRDHGDFIMVDDDQNWKDMTQLMQRKVSMQLKADNIQKHLHIQRQGRKAKVTQQKKKFKLPISFSKTSSKSGVSGGSEVTEDKTSSLLRSPKQQEHLQLQVNDLNTRIDIVKQDIEDKKLQMRAPGSYHEIHESLLLSHEKPSKEKSSPDEKSLFNKSKLGRKFTVPKIKGGSVEVKLRGKQKESGKQEESEAMSVRHSWSPDTWRTALREDASPTSPDSTSPSFHRHSLYNKRSPPKMGFLSSGKDFQPVLEAEEDLNITASSGNISQDTGYCSPPSQRKYHSRTVTVDTPLRDIVQRNNNTYTINETDTEHCQLCTSVDEMDTSKLQQISSHTLCQIKEFEEFIQTKLQLQV